LLRENKIFIVKNCLTILVIKKAMFYLLSFYTKQKKTVYPEQIFKKKKGLLITNANVYEKKNETFHVYRTRDLVYVGKVCLKNPISLRTILSKNK